LDQLLDQRHAPDPAAEVVCYVLRRLTAGSNPHATLPAGARVTTGSEGFYVDGQKLGIGSSAAVCTAVYVACCQFLGIRPDFDQLLQLHNGLQGTPGSGVDVAAAYYGGALRYVAKVSSNSRKPNAATVRAAAPDTAIFELPPELEMAFIWTGRTARTPGHIVRFNRWLERRQLAPLEKLSRTCEALFNNPDIATLARYVAELKDLDDIADLGIYSPSHTQLDQLAIDNQVVYKPCGAGGGDLGVAVGTERKNLNAFAAKATQLGFTKVPLEKADHGVQVAR
jgi:phosphomevalonate kinase